MLIYLSDHQVRHVRLNQAHPAQVPPSWYGDSVGYYEGDTLVVDTVGIKVGRYSMVDWYGTPHTQDLHVIERYRLLDSDAAREGFERDAKQHNVAPGMRTPNSLGKYLQLRFTIDDKGVFTTPWSATMTYGSNGNDPASADCHSGRLSLIRIRKPRLAYRPMSLTAQPGCAAILAMHDFRSTQTSMQLKGEDQTSQF